MTRDTEKALVILYSEYLRRRSFGTAKNQAAYFEDAKLRKIDAFSTWISEDISYAAEELRKLGYVSKNILGDVALTEEGIQFVEGKPKEFFSSFTGFIQGFSELIAIFLSF